MFKQLVLVLLVAVALSQICPSKVVQQCQADVKKAFDQCEKAAKEKGTDQQADINCVKYLLSSRKDCWPCVCEIAKKEGWKIKGCDFIMQLLGSFDKVKIDSGFNLRK